VLGLTFAQRETPVTDKYIEKAGEHESSAGAAAINWWVGAASGGDFP